MYTNRRCFLFKAIGLVFSTMVPVIAVFSYFPIWRERGADDMLSGISLLLILISAIPLCRSIRAALRSPSAPFVWFLIFIIFFSLSKIADDITAISFIGFLSNIVGSLFFSLAKRFEVTKKNEK